jgi:TP901 family phage tail tape measure protein
MAGFGGAVKLTGESEYRKALKNITQNLKEVASEMKLVSAQYSKNDTSTEALSAKSDVLSKKLEQQKNKVETLKKQYADMSTEYDENTQKHSALSKQYVEESNKLADLEKTLGTTSDEYKAQADVVADLQTELEKSTKAQESNTKTMSDMRIQLNNAETDLAKTSNELEALAKQMDDSASSSEELGNSLNDVGENADGATGGISAFQVALGNLVANVIGGAISKMQDLVASTIDVGATFESSMANVQAISGATDEELKLLSDTAKKFGSTTKFSASESADALGYMALAGWDAKTSAEALGGVLNLASSSGMELAQASDMVTDYLSAFGMQASESAYFADLLAYAQGNANTTAEGLGEAYKNCSANLASAGQDIETTTALLSMLANQGLKGSEAGTALNAVVRDMTSKMKDGAIEIGKTKIAVQDSEGNFRDLSEILKEVEQATNGMGTAQKASALQSTFTADSIKGLNLILNAGVDEANKFEEQLRNCSGTAEEMANTMNDNLKGDLTALNSQIEGVQISIYEKFEPALRKGVDALSALVDAVNFVVKHSTEFTTALVAMATAMGTYVAYTTAMKVMKDGWQALTIVTKAQTLAQTALNAVMSANPIGVVIALVAGLVTAFVVLWNKSEAFRNFWIGLWDNIKSVAEPIINGLVEWFSNAWDAIKSVWDGVQPYFQFLWNLVKAIFSGTVKQFFFKEFLSAWNSIKQVFAPFGEFFKGLWNDVKNTFTSLGTKIGDAIGKAVKSGINGVISQIERVINSGIDLINGAIRLINLLPGVSVGSVGRVRFPRLARGGIVDSATFAEIGEAGAEAVVPLENNTGWITKIAQQLATELAPAIVNATKSVNMANYNNNSYNDTVEAFKDALGQMKITLDDETLGSFVEKTVADAIYT